VSQERAIREYEEFRGAKPTKVIEYRMPDGDVDAWDMGEVTAIAYKTRRDGRTEDYIHEFGRKKGPRLNVAAGGTDVFLTGGKYRVTERGFEDDDDMHALLTVNPHQRGTRRKKKGLSAMATRRNSKGQFVKAGKKRKSNPVTPIKRKRRAAAKSVMPIRRRRRRSNPAGRGFNFFEIAKTAAVQAVGGVGAAAAIAALPLPENIKSGNGGVVAKLVAGAAIGWAAGKYINRRLGEDLFTGAVTVAAYAWLRDKAEAAGLPMAGADWDSYPYGGMAGFTNNPGLSDMSGFTANPDLAGKDDDDMAIYTASMAYPGDASFINQ